MSSWSDAVGFGRSRNRFCQISEKIFASFSQEVKKTLVRNGGKIKDAVEQQLHSRIVQLNLKVGEE